MIMFRFPDGSTTLHTGDFRANDNILDRLAGMSVDTLYLDTTCVVFDLICAEPLISKLDPAGASRQMFLLVRCVVPFSPK